MGFFFNRKSKDSEIRLPVVRKTQVLDFMLTVHPDICDLIWIENGEYKNWEGNLNTEVFEVMGIRFQLAYGSDEPSLINIDAPISTENLNEVDTPGYYPSYKGLSPQQRGLYWKFLKNPFVGGFDISYVFIFYYGLERHLYQGNYEKAVDVILRLRKIYSNSSFQAYSANAIVLTSLARKRPDFIVRLYGERDENLDGSLFPDLLLLCKLGLKESLTARDMMTLSRAFGFTNTNYLKKYPDIFCKALSERADKNPIIIADYFNEDKFVKLKRKAVPIYANYSINNNCIDIPAISTHPGLRDAIVGLLKSAHEDVKEYLKEQRKVGNKVEEAPKGTKKQKVFDEKREQKLLNDLAIAEGYVRKHYAYLGLYEFYYSYRELSLDNITLAEKYALEDIAILPQVQDEYKIQQAQERRYYMRHHLGKESKEEMDEMFNEKFCYVVPAFMRLCIIYEKDGKYRDALKICDQALAFYAEVGQEEERASFDKRKSSLEKKL